jgi:hypothetical protein
MSDGKAQEVAGKGSEGASAPASRASTDSGSKPKRGGGPKHAKAKESVKSKAKRPWGSSKAKKPKKHGRFREVSLSIEKLVIVPEIRDAVPASKEERTKLEESIDRDGGILHALIATSDMVLVDGHGRYAKAKKDGLKKLRVIIRDDLSYKDDAAAVKLAAIQYARERRNLTPEQILEIEKQRRKLEKEVQARIKMSEGAKKGQANKKLRKAGVSLPKSATRRSRAKAPGQLLGNTTVGNSLKIEEAFNAGELPIGVLEPKKLITTHKAHTILRATRKLTGDAKKAYLDKQEEIAKTVLALPAEEQKREATRLTDELLGKKPKRSTDNSYKPEKHEPEQFPIAGPAETPNAETKPNERVDVTYLIEQCKGWVIDLTKMAEGEDFTLTAEQKFAVGELVVDLRAAVDVLSNAVK